MGGPIGKNVGFYARVESEQNPMERLITQLFQKRQRSLTLTEDHLVSLLLLRRARESVLGDNLFSDPAWDILLELYAACMGERSMSMAELARAIETPQSTTARWIAALESRGLVSSKTNSSSPDRAQIQLTSDGALKMRHLGDHWGSAFVSI